MEITNVMAGEETEDDYSYYRSLTKDLDVSEGDSVYVVIARYSTGDTFGNDSGQYSIMDVFETHAEARGLLDAIEADAQGQRGRIYSYSFEHNGKEYETDWHGYFERFEGAGIHEVTIGKDQRSYRW